MAFFTFLISRHPNKNGIQKLQIHHMAMSFHISAAIHYGQIGKLRATNSY
jgi:hypothetical protein